MDNENTLDPYDICITVFDSETYYCRCVGYCRHYNQYLTAKQLKRKGCLDHCCSDFIKLEDNIYWKPKEVKEEKKRIEKALPEPVIIHKKREKRYVVLDLEMNELTSKERRQAKGLKGEVIQIGAVKLDEDFNCIDEFSIYVKPVYGGINDEIEGITGITDEMVSKADTFIESFHKFVVWAGDDVSAVVCWSDSDYKQLRDELVVKTKKYDEYKPILHKFVDLQASFGDILEAKYAISLDMALKFCCLKFKGNRHSAVSDAFNTARILQKLMNQNSYSIEFKPIWRTVDAEYTATIASFISPELRSKFSYKKEKDIKKAGFLSKIFTCTRYGIKPKKWFSFMSRMFLVSLVQF